MRDAFLRYVIALGPLAVESVGDTGVRYQPVDNAQHIHLRMKHTLKSSEFK